MTRVVVVGRDAELWLTAATIRRALRPAGVDVVAVELPSAIGPADLHATLPPLEALHAQLGLDEAAVLRGGGGCFTLGQNFTEVHGKASPFLHAYGSAGTAIAGGDFFPYWLKARKFGLAIGLEHFSLAAAAARQGRLLIPDDETEAYCRSDYGYHLPAQGYAATLARSAIREGVSAMASSRCAVLLDPDTGDIKAVTVEDGADVAGDLFVDATGPEGAVIATLAPERQSWSGQFPADRLLVAHAPAFRPLPLYAELRASPLGWTGLYPARAQTHVRHVWSSALAGDEESVRTAAAIAGLPVADLAVRPLDPGRLVAPWVRNCVAIGAAACRFDPVHDVGLLGTQIGLVQLLAHFPASTDRAAQRASYNRHVTQAFDRIRDFQAAHYACNRYDGPFWDRARTAAMSPELAHVLALFRARGEIAQWEEESIAPDSWRALLIGHGVEPESYAPSIDRTPPETVKAEIRTMLGFVKEHVLRAPSHDAYLDRVAGPARG